MSYQINDLRTGLTVKIDNIAFSIVDVDHVKPGKGSAFARVKLRNIKLGTVIERTFKSSDSINDAYIEERQLQYSYRTGDMLHFLDQNTFEDISLPAQQLEEQVDFLKDNLVVSAYFHEGDLLNVQLPNSVVYAITETEPGFKGNTAKSSGKPATLESGAVIQVPLFINVGEKVKIDTRTGEYLGRG